jgi:hypothetical protein
MTTIPLTRGFSALVDDDDVEMLVRTPWHAVTNHGITYASRKTYDKGERGTIYMHREILQPTANLFVDHIDGCGLNNQRSNLRSVTREQNHWNRHRPPSSRSGFFGVFPPTKGRRWHAQIHVHGKVIYLGSFATPYEAALAYDDAVEHYRGPLGVFNFPRVLGALPSTWSRQVDPKRKRVRGQPARPFGGKTVRSHHG